MFSPRSFPCPACREFINESMAVCRFCSTAIDPTAALSYVEQQEKINAACNSASQVRNLAGVMWVCFFVRFIPFVGLVGLVGMIILFFVVPVWLVFWTIKYMGIQTPDVDFKSAKRNVLMAFVLWVLMPIVFIVLALFLVGTLAVLSR